MLAMNSCEKENEMSTGEQKGTPVEFEMGINSITKTTTADDTYETTFAENDSVGIFVYNGTELVKANAHYKLNADKKWVAQGNDAIYAETGKTYSYYAYYPYNANPGNYDAISLAVKLDQKTNGYNSSDALMAKTDVETVAENTTVQLQYKHAYALAQVKLSGNDVAEGAVVTLENVFSVASINLKDQNQNAVSDVAGSITMKPCDATAANGAYYYRAIVPAQTIEAGKALVKVYSGAKTYQFTYDQAVEYKSGELRQINITLGDAPQESTITIAGADKEITDWGESTDLTGTGTSTEVMLVKEFGDTDFDEPVKDATSGKISTDRWIAIQSNSTSSNIVEITKNNKFSIETSEGTTWQKMGVLTMTPTSVQANSYYIAAIAYHHASQLGLQSNIYKLTFNAKCSTFTNDESKSDTLNVCVRTGKDDATFQISQASNPSFSETTATSVAMNDIQSDTWTSKTIYFNINGKSLGSPGSISTNNKYAEAVEDDKQNCTIYFYPKGAKTTANAGARSIYITDVVLEPYIAQ